MTNAANRADAIPRTAESLFRDFFLPLYPEDSKADLAKTRATDANPANNPIFLEHIADAQQRFVDSAPRLFGRDLVLDGSTASVHRVGAALTRDLREQWASSGAPGSPENELFNVVVHGALYTGACIAAVSGSRWLIRRPLWESRVFVRSKAGDAEVPPFHWWLRSLSDGELGAHTLGDRIRTYVETPQEEPKIEEQVFPMDRKLPRLAKVRYDLLHKHIKAHLPELKDLGYHFPSPERFAAYDFRTLDFFVVGNGRRLLLSGVASSGLHLFWLGPAGFEKSVFVPCETFPEPLVRSNGDKVEVFFRHEKKDQLQEFLYWGP